MAGNENIFITKKQTISAIDKIPESDFINEKYDTKYPENTKGIFFLLSTPRSGSTMICDLLYKSGFCLAHEYFQPYQYLPILADRWKCLQKDFLDKEDFVKKLMRFRTLKSGWLGINLHGEHLPTFLKFKDKFSNCKKIFLRIQRKNTIAQAVSYEIASQTGKWSSEFQTEVTPVYSFEKIKNKIYFIKQQDAMIDIFVSSINENVVELVYEDVVTNPNMALRSILPEGSLKKVMVKPSIEKQSSTLNKLWIDQFIQDFIETGGEGFSISQPKPISPKRVVHKIYNSLKQQMSQ